MLRDEDELDAGIDCPVCHRTFNTYARLEDHLVEHEGLRRCHTCSETIRGEYHRCR
jgi:hypothetical protein